MNQRHVLKFISLIVALIIWAYVLSTAHIQIEKSVPVFYKLPKGMALASPIQREVTYILDTPKAFIKSLLDRKDKIEVDLTTLKPRKRNTDKYVVDFQKNDIKLPIGVSVLQIIPKRTFITLEKKVNKTVELKTKFTNELIEGKRLASYQLRPDKIKLSGPKSLVASVKNLSVGPIDLSQLEASGQQAVLVDINDDRLSVESREVLFFYDVKATQSNVKLEHFPITFQSSKLIQKVSQRKVTLYLLADTPKLSEAQKKQIVVVAPVRVGSGKQRVKLQVDLPDGVELLRLTPESIVVYTE